MQAMQRLSSIVFFPGAITRSTLVASCKVCRLRSLIRGLEDKRCGRDNGFATRVYAREAGARGGGERRGARVRFFDRGEKEGCGYTAAAAFAAVDRGPLPLSWTGTQTSRPRTGGGRETSGPQRRRTFTTTPRFSSSSKKKLSSFTRHQEIQLIEGLYTSGQISRDEWRASVFAQAGVREEEEGVEERVRLVREWFGGKIVVPGDLLEEEERVVHERLFGPVRSVGVDDESQVVGEGEEEEGGGVRVLREDGEEVEFEEEEEEVMMDERRTRWKISGDEMLARDIERVMDGGEEAYTPFNDSESQDQGEDAADGDGAEPDFVRTHPLTLSFRFGSAVDIPKTSLIDPITHLISDRKSHIPVHALRIFGGPGLPYSTSTPARGRTLQQKPIPLDAAQVNMAEMDADVYLASLTPGVYASVMSALTETRKRLGTSWAEGLVNKAERGELRILDVGGAGMGVLAVREMIRAEWERMHDSDIDGLDSSLALAEADGRVGGASLSPPLGHATVLVGSDALRHRASKLLDNTTFIPRLPDYLHSEDAIKMKGKFDLILAPHSLWPLREDYLRKAHVQNLWHLLHADGGVLLLLEKGVARGFEMIAGARDLLLERNISSPGDTLRSTDIDEVVEEDDEEYQDDMLTQPKGKGMIVAPCTNHVACPLYTQKGHVKGRRAICAFEQRYHRPAFMQQVYGGSKGKNHEDVEFSYLSVLRGRDLRRQTPEEEQNPLPTTVLVEQGEVATAKAFKGYEAADEDSAALPPNGLSLPRAIFPPLKRTGHVILDVCTPTGTLERWTVPRSFSKRAFRDARKSSWGDLWALGAKTRVGRNGLLTKKSRISTAAVPPDMDANIVVTPDGSDGSRNRRNKRSGGQGRYENFPEGVKDEEGEVVLQEGLAAEFGRVRGDDGSSRSERLRGKKVKGVREKRDKKGTGNGRWKMGGSGRFVLREAHEMLVEGRREG